MNTRFETAPYQEEIYRQLKELLPHVINGNLQRQLFENYITKKSNIVTRNFFSHLNDHSHLLSTGYRYELMKFIENTIRPQVYSATNDSVRSIKLLTQFLYEQTIDSCLATGTMEKLVEAAKRSHCTLGHFLEGKVIAIESATSIQNWSLRLTITVEDDHTHQVQVLLPANPGTPSNNTGEYERYASVVVYTNKRFSFVSINSLVSWIHKELQKIID